jgi:L-cysteine/cystine lyase
MDRSPSAEISPALATLREQFPVLRNWAYMNAGTDGPLPATASAAAVEELDRQTYTGRTAEHFERRQELETQLRAAYAGLLGCPTEEVALTTCTSEGMSIVVGGLGLGPDDEILTSDSEHPGLLGALQAARDLCGVQVRLEPLETLPEKVAPHTKLVACSHVSWVSGCLAPAALASLSDRVTVMLDGAQGVGAVGVDVHALGCHAYAGPGQKWLCGPDGLGMLYVSSELSARLHVTRRGYANFEEANAGMDAPLHTDARRFDCFALGAETVACALGAMSVFDEVGWEAIHVRAAELADTLVARLGQLGRAVAPRGRSTLVSFHSADPPAERLRLAERGVVVRDIPNRALLRASVGAWNNEQDIERLIDGLGELS